MRSREECEDSWPEAVEENVTFDPGVELGNVDEDEADLAVTGVKEGRKGERKEGRKRGRKEGRRRGG